MNKPLAEIIPPQYPPRRYTTKPFPSYRFVPGLNPHPTENPQGHSYGIKEEGAGIFDPKEWRTNEIYLYGVDLYNNAFWWEAHEAFEKLWSVVPKNDARGYFLQGLIKISAAFLKWHLQEQKGVGLLYSGARKHLDIVVATNSHYMGLNLEKHLVALEKHFSPVLQKFFAWPNPVDHYPFILLDI